jgi:DNA polymerase-3 subunit epsilon
VPLRRCAVRVGRNTALDNGPPCVPAQLGVATCPCRCQLSEAGYAELADTVRRGLRHEPALLYAPLEARMHRLAEAERFEEAALTRDRLATLVRALERRRSMDALRGADRIVIDSDEGRIELRHGRLVLDDDGAAGAGAGAGDGTLAETEPPDLELPPGREEADELMLVSRWLRKTKHARCEFTSGTAASHLAARVSDVTFAFPA